MLNRLPWRSAFLRLGLLLDQAHLLCFPQVNGEDEYHRRTYCGNNDTECTEAPSPCAALQYRLGCSRASEGVGYVRSRREAEEDHAVLEFGSIGYEYLQYIANSVHAGPEEDLTGSIGLDVAARGH